jgi:sec-independent protein translocase protein TatC
MSLAEHLIEFRKRILISAAGVLVGMVIAFIITEPIVEFLTYPIRLIDEERGDDFAQLIFTTVTGPFDLRMRMALSVGLILSAPIWLWQIWAYIVPGLSRKEVRFTAGFVGSALPLFVLGCAVALWLSPNVIRMLAFFTPNDASNLFEGKEYYDFILKFVLAIGVGFVLPVFLVALNLAGVMSGRAILNAWRPAVLIATLFAGITTPAADAFSMLLLAIILIALYFAAALLSMMFDRRRRKRESLAESEPPIAESSA